MRRVIAGVFAGVGGLLCIALGVLKPEHPQSSAMVTGGMLLLSNMFTFFVGEKNGERKASE